MSKVIAGSLTATLMYQGLARICKPAAPNPLDEAITMLHRSAARLSDAQLDKIGEIYSEALIGEDGLPHRQYKNVELEGVLQDAREFDPEPIGPDYESIDAPYLTEREQREADEHAANVYGAARLGDPAL